MKFIKGISSIQGIIFVAALLFLSSLIAYPHVKDIHVTFLEFCIASLGAFSTATAVSVYYLQLKVMTRTIEENKKIADRQMETSIMPDLFFEELTFAGVETKIGNGQVNIEYCYPNSGTKARLKIRNCGFGIAKNITFHWVYDFAMVNDYLRKNNVPANKMVDTQEKITLLFPNQVGELKMPKHYLRIFAHDASRVVTFYIERPVLKLVATYFNNYGKEYEVEVTCKVVAPQGMLSNEIILTFIDYKKIVN